MIVENRNIFLNFLVIERLLESKFVRLYCWGWKQSIKVIESFVSETNVLYIDLLLVNAFLFVNFGPVKSVFLSVWIFSFKCGYIFGGNTENLCIFLGHETCLFRFVWLLKYTVYCFLANVLTGTNIYESVNNVVLLIEVLLK